MLFLSDVNLAEFASRRQRVRRAYNAADRSLRRKAVRGAGLVGLAAGGLLGYGAARSMGSGAGLSALAAAEGAGRGAFVGTLGTVGTLWAANKLRSKRKRRRY